MTIRYENRRVAVADKVMAVYERLTLAVARLRRRTARRAVAR